MSGFVDYVNHGASLITARVVENVLRQLPLWKVEFTQINAPKFPHLVDQLEFLADAVEDFAEGAYKDIPYYAVPQAVFASPMRTEKWTSFPISFRTLAGPMTRAWFALSSSKTKRPLPNTPPLKG